MGKQVVDIPPDLLDAIHKAGFSSVKGFLAVFLENFQNGHAFILEPCEAFLVLCKSEGRDPATVLNAFRTAYASGRVKWEQVAPASPPAAEIGRRR